MTSQIAGWEQHDFYEKTNAEGLYKTTGTRLQEKAAVDRYWVHTTGDLYLATQVPQEIDTTAMEKAKTIMELHLKYDGLEAASQLWLAGVHTLNRVKRLETNTAQSLALAASFLFLCMSASEVGATISTIMALGMVSAAFSYAGYKVATAREMQDKQVTQLAIGMGVLGVLSAAWKFGLSLNPVQGLLDLTLLGMCAATVAVATCLVGKMVLPAPRILPSQPTPYDPATQARASWKRFNEMRDVRSKVSALKREINPAPAAKNGVQKDRAPAAKNGVQMDRAPAARNGVQKDQAPAAKNGLEVLRRLKELDEQRTGSKKSWAEFQRMSFLNVIDQLAYRNMSISWAQSEQMERVGNLEDRIEGGQLRFEPATPESIALVNRLRGERAHRQ